MSEQTPLNYGELVNDVSFTLEMAYAEKPYQDEAAAYNRTFQLATIAANALLYNPKEYARFESKVISANPSQQTPSYDRVLGAARGHAHIPALRAALLQKAADASAEVAKNHYAVSDAA